MTINDLPFTVVDWSRVEPSQHPGETGLATWRTRQFGSIRVRMIEYSAGYLADHWCSKGHILLVVDGELVTELENGERHVLRPGMSYQVADGEMPHRSLTTTGARLFVVD